MTRLVTFFKKRKISLLGLASGLLFCLLFYVFLSFENSELLVYLFYLPVPAAIFGLFMLAALGKYKWAHAPEFLVLFSILIYLFLFFVLISDGVSFLLEFRRLLMGGTGAVLFILAVRFMLKFPFTKFDYLLAFISGTATTFFMWMPDDPDYAIDLPFTFLALVLWQLAVAIIIDRRVTQSNILELSEEERAVSRF